MKKIIEKDSAIMVEAAPKTMQLVESDGLFQCLMNHEIKSTKASFKWTGPKIDQDKWDEMLAFFRWTQKEFKSEAQVRLFVHPVHGWLIWAFPQKGNTGMTTTEVANDEAKAQRAAIGEGYRAFGTVHHHCNMAAFQSSTDTEDEKSVEGLHITIGDLEAEEYSIHCRLYIKSAKFEPMMQSFWDIGTDTEEGMMFVEDLGFETDKLRDAASRKQMCTPPPDDLPFNETWKGNYLVEKPKTYEPPESFPGSKGLVTGHNMHFPGHHHGHHMSSGSSRRYWSVERLLDDIKTQAMVMGFDEAAFIEAATELCDGQNSELYKLIADECNDNFIKWSDFYTALIEDEIKEERRQEKMDAMASEGGNAPGAGAEEHLGY